MNCTNSSGSANCSEYFDDIYDVPLGFIVLLSFLYGSISVVAVAGNMLVMWIVLSSKAMQNVTNWYIANLALADIAIGFFAIPFEVSCFVFNVGHYFRTMQRGPPGSGETQNLKIEILHYNNTFSPR